MVNSQNEHIQKANINQKNMREHCIELKNVENKPMLQC